MLCAPFRAASGVLLDKRAYAHYDMRVTSEAMDLAGITKCRRVCCDTRARRFSTEGAEEAVRLTVEELEHRYMRPQENGNRTDVRSVEITNGDGNGFCISSDFPFEFQLQRYSQEKLEKAMHLYELEEDEYLSLSIDAKQRGVGGDMPGTACLHEPYKMKRGSYSFAFKIEGVTK